MTETATPEVTAPEAENTTQAPARETLDALSQALLSACEPKMAELKSISEKQAAIGNVGKALSEAIEQSQDEDVVKRRQVIEKANEAILRVTKELEELVKPTLNLPTDEELELMDTKYKVLASEVNSYNQAFVVETSKAFDGLSVFDYLGDMPGKRRGAKTGQGTGSARPRVKSIEYRNAMETGSEFTKAEKNDKSTFSILSGVIKDETKEIVTAGDFHDAWLEQTGVKDWNDAPEVSTFVYSLTDGEGKNHQYEIRVTK